METSYFLVPSYLYSRIIYDSVCSSSLTAEASSLASSESESIMASLTVLSSSFKVFFGGSAIVFPRRLAKYLSHDTSSLKKLQFH